MFGIARRRVSRDFGLHTTRSADRRIRDNTEGTDMGIGTSILLIAIGAILKFAVTASVSGVSLSTVGVILMIVGALGLLISVIMGGYWTRRGYPPPPADPLV